jgi:hypothetical protein
VRIRAPAPQLIWVLGGLRERVKSLGRQLMSVGIACVCLGIPGACVRVSEPAPGEIVGTWRLTTAGDEAAVDFLADQTCHADPAFAAFVASCNGPGRKSSDGSCFWGRGKDRESDEVQVVMEGTDGHFLALRMGAWRSVRNQALGLQGTCVGGAPILFRGEWCIGVVAQPSGATDGRSRRATHPPLT